MWLAAAGCSGGDDGGPVATDLAALQVDAPCTPDGEVRDDCAHAACTHDFALHPDADLYCTRQYCDDYYGAWSSIYCIPDC